ncbi:MAG: translation initiation factor IF-2 N-terminal domain-containing protein, partial [Desulfobacterales bacterium]|nr:translation initiation factor IF-2 N-terminal domain-containing protein [Desulfobacterales bacterium]
MAKIRIYELAKQLNMTNKVLLERLIEMNITVKSHMSVIDEETVAGIKEALFQGKSEIVTEKRIKGAVIRRRRKVIEKKPEAEGIIPVARAESEIPSKLKEKEMLEVKPDQIAPPMPDEALEEQVAEVVEPQEPAAKTKVETHKEAASEPVGAKAMAAKARPAKKARVKKKPKARKERPAKIIKMPEVRPPADVTRQKELAAPVKRKATRATHLKLVPKEEGLAATAKVKTKKKGKKKLL